MSIVGESEAVPALDAFGIRAFITTRTTGSFGLMTDESVATVMGRWAMLRRELKSGGSRLATSTQVHGATVLVHHPGWDGWLRGNEADGHLSMERGTAMAVTVADCVPVFVAHPSGAIALLHSGWRGTAARIIERAIEMFSRHGLRPSDLRLHAGPAICGACYEVSPDVYLRLTGRHTDKPTTVDLRAIIADHAHALGVRHITTSASCTRHDNDRFYSHRAGDDGRQLGVMIADVD